MSPAFYTKSGHLTRYALACGYIEVRGNGERDVRLERVPHSNAVLVRQSGGETLYLGTSLREARQCFNAEARAIEAFT